MLPDWSSAHGKWVTKGGLRVTIPFSDGRIMSRRAGMDTLKPTSEQDKPALHVYAHYLMLLVDYAGQTLQLQLH